MDKQGDDEGIVPRLYYDMLDVHKAYQLSFYLGLVFHLRPHKFSSKDAKSASTVQWNVSIIYIIIQIFEYEIVKRRIHFLCIKNTYLHNLFSFLH